MLPERSYFGKKGLCYCTSYVVGMVAGASAEKVMKILKSHHEQEVGMLRRNVDEARALRTFDTNAGDCATFSFLLRKLSVDREMMSGGLNRVG